MKYARSFNLFIAFFSVLFFSALPAFALDLVESRDVLVTATVGTTITNDTEEGTTSGGYSIPTRITLSGRAYPNSPIVILKNGQEASRVTAGPDATFYATVNGLTPGTYMFSVYGEDDAGRRSTLFTFPIFITRGATTSISGIFLPPTIEIDKAHVRQGESVTIFGTTVPNSSVTVSVRSNPENFYSVFSDTLGRYSYILNTTPLDKNIYLTKSKATALDNQISVFGKIMSFIVGDTDVAENNVCRIADLNCDDKVNLVDFSILAFWYHKNSPPHAVDINSDGTINLSDFSIMAYYWTG